MKCEIEMTINRISEKWIPSGPLQTSHLVCSRPSQIFESVKMLNGTIVTEVLPPLLSIHFCFSYVPWFIFIIAEMGIG